MRRNGRRAASRSRIDGVSADSPHPRQNRGSARRPGFSAAIAPAHPDRLRARRAARLADAHVVVIGAGGLGSTVLPALAAAGVGTITIVDDDTVDASNLHRQTLYAPSDVGRAKVDAAADALARLAPDVTIVRHGIRFAPGSHLRPAAGGRPAGRRQRQPRHPVPGERCGGDPGDPAGVGFGAALLGSGRCRLGRARASTTATSFPSSRTPPRTPARSRACCRRSAPSPAR